MLEILIFMNITWPGPKFSINAPSGPSVSTGPQLKDYNHRSFQMLSNCKSNCLELEKIQSHFHLTCQYNNSPFDEGWNVNEQKGKKLTYHCELSLLIPWILV